jgi:hypothetical protein
MKKAQFAETKIVSILQQQGTGIPVKDLAREQGMSEVTFLSIKHLLAFMFFFLISSLSYAQFLTHSQNLKNLDEGFFKWRRFSFVQEWDTLKSVCDLEKIDAYPEYYLDFYCGNISDTTKSYFLRNEAYNNFNHFQFDQAILHLVGSKNSPYNCGSLLFVKKFNQQPDAETQYHELLQSLKKTYGNALTQHLGKFRQERTDSMSKDAVYISLNDAYPFDSAEQTEWKGDKYITMRLDYIPENSLIFLVVNEYPTNAIFRPAANLFAASEYSEQFTKDFKEFDRKNGFKKLRFGMPRSAVELIVKLRQPHPTGDYEVATAEYCHWYDLEFNTCDLTFNKKDKLDDVSLFKIDFSDDDYDKLLKDMSDLLGTPTNFKEISAGSEFTRWKGKKIQLIVLRGNDNTITVDINCPSIDDSSPSDKLY